jgi:hypothetical protein
MGDRVSEMVLLCEDDPQEQIVRRYLGRCGLRTMAPTLRVRNASREVYGGNVDWVLKEFPKEVAACRRRHAAHAKTLLIVVVDADEGRVVDRRAELPTNAGDPVVALIPKRHIETWIRSALGQAANESDSYKNPPPAKADIRAAADQIHGWARNNPAPGATCVDSLRTSLPEFRLLG